MIPIDRRLMPGSLDAAAKRYRMTHTMSTVVDRSSSDIEMCHEHDTVPKEYIELTTPNPLECLFVLMMEPRTAAVPREEKSSVGHTS